jgi:BCD family chlorophyll transporter-like MFS transporter
MQILRPRLGHGSDRGGRRTPWIVGGMAVLASGGFVSALATAWMSSNLGAGILLAVAGFTMIGVGVGATGTTLLVLLAKQVEPARRAAAATIVWVMMIVGFIITTVTVGHFLDPYSPARLVEITAIVGVIAFVTTVFAIHRVERVVTSATASVSSPAAVTHSFRKALADVWAEPRARRFTLFVFFSMLAYSAQDLILEPYAGTVFAYTPGQSTKLSGVQQSGVLLGMLLVAVVGSTRIGRRTDFMQVWTIGGCIASALALMNLAATGIVGNGSTLPPAVFLLGLTNGAYAIAAIGSMMSLVDHGTASREGVRMGLWGAAQAIAFGVGGFVGTVAVDIARWVIDSPSMAYATVFIIEGLVFVVAAFIARHVQPPAHAASDVSIATTVGWPTVQQSRG